MGDHFATARLQFRAHPLGHRPRPAVGEPRRPALRHRPARGPQGAAGHHRHRRPARSARGGAAAEHVAAARRHRHHGHADRLDLHALGRGLGRDPGRHRPGRLAVAARRGNAGRTGAAAMTRGPVQDVSHLPSVAFGHRQPIWWGTLGFMVIEGTGFVMVVAAYFYLASQNPDWPMNNPPPSLLWGTALLAFLLATELPNSWIKRAAKHMDLRRVRILIFAMAALGLVAVGIRALEFTTLNTRWDTNPYGSVVWALMFLHTLHIVTDVAETS